MCVCSTCSNLEDLVEEDLKKLSCCSNSNSEDFLRFMICLKSKKSNHCFVYTEKKERCADCNHICDQKFRDYIHSELAAYDWKSYNIKFRHIILSNMNNRSFIPCDAPQADMTASDGVNLAIKFIENGLFHYVEYEHGKEPLKQIKDTNLMNKKFVYVGSDYATKIRLAINRNT